MKNFKISDAIKTSVTNISFYLMKKKLSVSYLFMSFLFVYIFFLTYQVKGNPPYPVKFSLATREIVIQDTINHPEVVNPKRDGTLHLRAEIAKAVGPEIKYMPEWKAFGWFTSSDRVEWDVEVSKGGEYEVYLEWSVSDKEAGKPFVLEAGKQRLNGIVGRTGSWETYKSEKVGTIKLTTGRQKMVFKPNSKFEKDGALLDLREVKLVFMK